MILTDKPNGANNHLKSPCNLRGFNLQDTHATMANFTCKRYLNFGEHKLHNFKQEQRTTFATEWTLFPGNQMDFGLHRTHISSHTKTHVSRRNNHMLTNVSWMRDFSRTSNLRFGDCAPSANRGMPLLSAPSCGDSRSICRGQTGIRLPLRHHSSSVRPSSTALSRGLRIIDDRQPKR